MARGKLVCLEGLLEVVGITAGDLEYGIEARAETAWSGKGEAGATDDSWGSSRHVAEQEGVDAKVKGGVRGREVCAGG